jgi:hypothetical protein
MQPLVTRIAIIIGVIGIITNLIIGFMLWGSTGPYLPTPLSSLIYGVLLLVFVEIVGLYFIAKRRTAGPVLFFISGIVLILFGYLFRNTVINTLSYGTPTFQSTLSISVNLYLFLMNALILFIAGILAWFGREKVKLDTVTRFRMELDEIMHE